MPTIRFSRPFSSGSRPTPDPFDKFLDSNGFYRKHTPRDSTNLFRVVSEQLYDTQDHHLQVRKDCVNFLIKHREQYEELIGEDFDHYVQKMAKTTTPGGEIELRAMGYLFKRNIIVYHPFELGKPFVDEPEYKEPVLRVFHATHFDSVFEKSFIANAEFCQSVVYEMLYKKVFKLPDIEYSVETMLHSDINHEPSKHEYENGDQYATHIVFEDGRKFELDRPENTLCILSDPERCHFHNENFEESVKKDARRFDKAILSDKYNSCVRQLLFDGITPFPYKVAKALDENIYRNVEFDSWSDERKTFKFRPNFYKVGVECLVKLSETKDELMKCRIQARESDSSYVVFIDKLAEKRSVAYTSLRPLNGAQRDPFLLRESDQYAKDLSIKKNIEKFGFGLRNGISRITSQPSNDLNFNYDAICNSFDFEPYISLSNFNFIPNNQTELIACPMVYSQSTNMSSNTNAGANTTSSKPPKNRNQNQNQNLQNHVVIQSDANDKQQQNQKGDNDNSYGKSVHESKTADQPAPIVTTGYYQQQPIEQHVDAIVPTTQHHMTNYHPQGTGPIYYCSTPEYGEQGIYSSEMVMQPGAYMIQAPYQAQPMQPSVYAPVSGNHVPQYPVSVGGWPAYTQPINPQGYVFSGPPQYALPTVPATMPLAMPFLSRELLHSNGRINFNLNYAQNPSGDDLPMNDKVSVRFYYNLGIEYFKFLQHVHGYGALMGMIDGDNVSAAYDQPPNDGNEGQSNQLISDFQNLNVDPNEGDIQSPSKPRMYIDSGYRRNPNIKYNKRTDRPIPAKHFQGSYQGPTRGFAKNHQKYNQGGGNSYDSTPMKDNGNNKPHQHQGYVKREQPNADADNGNGNANSNFGSNVPPFNPFLYDQNEHYGPPGNVYTRNTPPGNRPASVPNAQYHHNNHQVQAVSYQGGWLQTAHPGSHQSQSLPHQPQQSQTHSLNTSGASNPSQ